METEVSRGEIELLVVGGIIGNVHLAVFAGDAAVFLNDYGGVVVETGSTFLEQRGYDDNPELLRQFSVESCGRTGVRQGRSY